MSPPPGLAAVSVGLPALDSCLLAFGLIDVVCLGPVFLFPGLAFLGWIDVVCLGLSSSSLGLPVVGLVCRLWCACVCAWLPWYAVVGFGL